MEYRHQMEAYFKMLYVNSYYELVNTYDGASISINKKNNALKAEQELKDRFNITFNKQTRKFEGKINNTEAAILFDNMRAMPDNSKEYWDKKIKDTKDNIQKWDKETEENMKHTTKGENNKRELVVVDPDDIEVILPENDNEKA